MEIILSFFTGFFLNEGRMLYRIYGNNLKYIKRKIIINDFGYLIFLALNVIVFLKGFIFSKYFFNQSNLHDMLLIFFLIIGLYLGSKPINPDGSELVIILGAIAEYNWEVIKITLALFISIVILTRSPKVAFLIILIMNLVVLLQYNGYLFVVAIILILNYVRYNYALFSPWINTINRRFNYPLKGVKSLYESILYTFTQVFKKRFEKSI